MTLKDVYRPIQGDLDRVVEGLRALATTFGSGSSRALAQSFFRQSGKLLRPALVLLSARSVGSAATAALVDTALGVELIHGASLVHDDILDDDTERRGQPTLNGAHGTKLALLVGDALYSRAFGLLTRSLPADDLGRVADLIEGMCAAEIEQAQARGDLRREAYFAIIEGKTASFMALCCRLGARLGGGTEAQVEAAVAFGLRFGLAYQLFDDLVDGDLGCRDVGPADAGEQLGLARAALAGLPDNPGRAALGQLGDYLAEVQGTKG